MHWLPRRQVHGARGNGDLGRGSPSSTVLCSWVCSAIRDVSKSLVAFSWLHNWQAFTGSRGRNQSTAPTSSRSTSKLFPSKSCMCGASLHMRNFRAVCHHSEMWRNSRDASFSSLHCSPWHRPAVGLQWLHAQAHRAAPCFCATDPLAAQNNLQQCKHQYVASLRLVKQHWVLLKQYVILVGATEGRAENCGDEAGRK